LENHSFIVGDSIFDIFFFLGPCTINLLVKQNFGQGFFRTNIAFGRPSFGRRCFVVALALLLILVNCRWDCGDWSRARWHSSGSGSQYSVKQFLFFTQQFCTLIVAGQIWDPDTDTVRIFTGKFDPEEFDRNPEKQGQVVPALTPVSFEGKRVALEAVYGAESRENR
jgi:hypothetical protein